MASLMQVHQQLMAANSRHVEMYNRLLDREQVIAELRMYVKLLEEQLEKDRAEKAAQRESKDAAKASAVGRGRAAVPRDGWKAW
jgi:hypothetical protein